MREINSTIDESTARSTGDTLAPNQLFTRCSNSLKEKWSSAELKDLVEFVLFHCTGELWPSHKQMGFWETASTFVASRSDSIAYRSGNFNIFYNVTTNHSLLAASACRSQVVGCLKKQYKTPKDAEKVFFQDLQAAVTQDLEACLVQSAQVSSTSYSHSGTQSDTCAFQCLFGQLPADIQLVVLLELFVMFTKDELNISVPEDFLFYAAKAMVQLKAAIK